MGHHKFDMSSVKELKWSRPKSESAIDFEIKTIVTNLDIPYLYLTQRIQQPFRNYEFSLQSDWFKNSYQFFFCSILVFQDSRFGLFSIQLDKVNS